MLTAATISLIEAHDAVISELRVQHGATLTVCFSSILVYVRQVSTDERYDLWLYKADLVLRGLGHLEVRGALESDDRVSDIYAGEGASPPLNLTSMLSVTPAATIRVVLAGSGSEVLIACSSGQLKLLDATERLEEWEGPLIADPR